MKATFYLPAHPSYFDDECTQEEIERAILAMDQFHSGTILKGNQRTEVKHEYVFLREPGKSVTVRFESAGVGDGKTVPESAKAHAIEQYRASSRHDLGVYVHNLKDILKQFRIQRNQ